MTDAEFYALLLRHCKGIVAALEKKIEAEKELIRLRQERESGTIETS